MASKRTHGPQVAQALMVQALQARTDAEIVAFMAAQLGDLKDDQLMAYIAHRIDLVAMRLEAEDAAANKSEEEQ